MTDVPTTATDRPAGGERRVHSRVTLIRTLVVVQLYTFAAYLAAAVVPYLWDPRPYPPTWMWIVPGWLLGVPGFFITMLGPVPGIVLELAGISTLVSARHSCPPR
jgi:hypothetical protein